MDEAAGAVPHSDDDVVRISTDPADLDIDWIRASRDAADLYRGHGGFEPLANPERWMERRSARPDGR